MIIPYEPDYLPPEKNFFSLLGRHLLLTMRGAGRALIILADAVMFIPLCLERGKELARQMFLVGIKSFGVTSTVAVFTGMILALQAGLELKNFGQEMRVGTIVSESMCREMGPMMTALILAASVGAAMAAELGTMAVSEEIAALEVMSINPVRFLVMPRLLAMAIMCPALMVYTNIIGIIGGGLVAYTQLGVPWSLYYENVIMYLDAKEIWVGVFKAFVFSVAIVTISCYQGLATRGGAVGVGKATRRAVVVSFLMVIILGYVITRIFY